MASVIPAVAHRLTGLGESRALLEAIVEYDEVFAGYLEDPLPVTSGSVTVSGIGEESFKTFNVSTAAAILAAAAGVPAIKGVFHVRCPQPSAG